MVKGRQHVWTLGPSIRACKPPRPVPGNALVKRGSPKRTASVIVVSLSSLGILLFRKPATVRANVTIRC